MATVLDNNLALRVLYDDDGDDARVQVGLACLSEARYARSSIFSLDRCRCTYAFSIFSLLHAFTRTFSLSLSLFVFFLVHSTIPQSSRQEVLF